MKINHLRLQNFYSYQKAEINFDNFQGINSIEGKNKDDNGSNGVGKSALIEGVSWVIFGSTLRKSTEEAMVNNQEQKNCEGEILINDSIRIIRGRRPSKLELYVNGEVRTKASAKDTQKEIESILNISYKVFAASFVFGQHNSMNFLSSSPDDKRLIMRSFLNLDEIFINRAIVKDLKSSYAQEIKKCDALINDYNNEYSITRDKINLIQKDRDKYNFPLEVRNLSLSEVLTAESDYLNLTRAKVDVKKVLKANQSELDDILEKLNIADSKIHKLCHTCGTKYLVTLTEDEVEKLKKRKSILKGLITKDTKKLEELTDQEKVKPLVSSSEFEKFTKYKEICDKEDVLKSLLANYDAKLDSLEEERLKNERWLDIMKFWEVAFSESGLVKYVIRSILEYFNNRCNHYLSYLTNGKYFISFDDSLNETIYINNKKIFFVSLSGGERRKVNLAVMLALQSLLDLTDIEKSNILFLDEIARDLDPEGIDGLYILLQELQKTKTIFIITHNPYFKSLINECNSIKLVKQNGISKIV